MHAAEESEKLAYHNVNYGRAVVTRLSQPGAVDNNIVAAYYGCRNIITDYQLQQAKVFLIKLTHQITLISSDGGIGRQQANDERIGINVAHGTMAQTQIGLRHRTHFAGGHFEHLQPSFASCTQACTGPQKYRTPEIQACDLRKGAEMVLQKFADYSA